jgi:hypothetical protein
MTIEGVLAERLSPCSCLRRARSDRNNCAREPLADGVMMTGDRLPKHLGESQNRSRPTLRHQPHGGSQTVGLVLADQLASSKRRGGRYLHGLA